MSYAQWARALDAFSQHCKSGEGHHQDGDAMARHASRVNVVGNLSSPHPDCKRFQGCRTAHISLRITGSMQRLVGLGPRMSRETHA